MVRTIDEFEMRNMILDQGDVISFPRVVNNEYGIKWLLMYGLQCFVKNSAQLKDHNTFEITS